MQLHALLKSLDFYAKDFFNHITIIYKTSNRLHSKTYKQLISNYTNILFLKENFLASFKKLLTKSLQYSSEYIVFMTDDDLLFSPLTANDKQAILTLMHQQSLVTFSLRLGLNCTYSHPANLHFQLKNYAVIQSDYLLWNWKEQDKGDFNYPLSIDGHIFKMLDFMEWIQDFNGQSPNHLEAYIQKENSVVSKMMGAYTHSKLVGIPINLVSDFSSNYYGKKYCYNQDDLAKKYLNGYIIDFLSMDFSNINSAHQELELKFKKYKE